MDGLLAVADTPADVEALEISMISSRSARLIPLILAGTLIAGHAQQAQPVQPAPVIGLPVPPLGSGPFEFQAAEQQKLRVSVVARGLSHPWSVVFLPDASMLITERPAGSASSATARSIRRRLPECRV